ncbi:hypothetical protein ACPFZZ_000850, partial [Shigella boydii]
VGYPQTNRKIDTGKTLTRWPVFVDHFSMTPTLSHDFFSKLPAVLQPLLHSGIMLATLSAVVLNVFFNGYQHHADLVKESVSDKDLKVRTVLLMRKLKKNEHGE